MQVDLDPSIPSSSPSLLMVRNLTRIVAWEMFVDLIKIVLNIVFIELGLA